MEHVWMRFYLRGIPARILILSRCRLILAHCLSVNLLLLSFRGSIRLVCNASSISSPLWLTPDDVYIYAIPMCTAGENIMRECQPSFDGLDESCDYRLPSPRRQLGTNVQPIRPLTRQLYHVKPDLQCLLGHQGYRLGY
jgi:hypothetical protein